MGILKTITSILGTPEDVTEKSPVKAPPGKENESRKKVLIVEDDSFLLDMYADKFTHEGYEVVKAKNGQEGLDLLMAQKPNAVILDLMMPVLDGKGMLRKLREIPEFRNLPVIILTNAGQTDNIRETQRYFDAVAFFIKSNVDLNDLVKKLKETIG